MSPWHWRRSAESMWFYAAWFCLFAAAVLFVAQRKYGERQAGIERRFQARAQPYRQAAGEQLADNHERSTAHYSTPEDTVIPIWPLAVVMVVLGCSFGVLAVRAGCQTDAAMDSAD